MSLSCSYDSNSGVCVVSDGGSDANNPGQTSVTLSGTDLTGNFLPVEIVTALNDDVSASASASGFASASAAASVSGVAATSTPDVGSVAASTGAGVSSSTLAQAVASSAAVSAASSASVHAGNTSNATISATKSIGGGLQGAPQWTIGAGAMAIAAAVLL
jgi:hypothetical protein